MLCTLPSLYHLSFPFSIYLSTASSFFTSSFLPSCCIILQSFLVFHFFTCSSCTLPSSCSHCFPAFVLVLFLLPLIILLFIPVIFLLGCSSCLPSVLLNTSRFLIYVLHLLSLSSPSLLLLLLTHHSLFRIPYPSILVLQPITLSSLYTPSSLLSPLISFFLLSLISMHSFSLLPSSSTHHAFFFIYFPPLPSLISPFPSASLSSPSTVFSCS